MADSPPSPTSSSSSSLFSSSVSASASAIAPAGAPTRAISALSYGSLTPAEIRKLKRRVDPTKRKRIALACDSCKRRKQKCNGADPCSICMKKNFACHYSPTKEFLQTHSISLPSVNLKSPLDVPKVKVEDGHGSTTATDTINSQSNNTLPPLLPKSPQKPRMSPEVHKIPQLPQSPSSPPPPSPPQQLRATSDSSDESDGQLSTATSEQSPPRHHRKRSRYRTDYQVETVGDGRNTRLLWDEKGHMRYMGESGVLSFLEQSRKTFRKVMGDSQFTLDPAQFRFIDGPTHTASMIPLQLPPRSMTNELIQAFEDNVQAFDYVFDMDHFRYQIAQTYRNPMGTPKQWLCLLHFACALGAIYVSSKYELDTVDIPQFNDSTSSTPTGQQAAASTPTASQQQQSAFTGKAIDPAPFFSSGLGLMTDAAEDGELWVVQAYLLMSLYYLIICKRNASWIQLGSAIRFAQALGLHRKCVNMTFPKPQRLLRQRLWRTLYIQDRFWSSAMGRPLAIDDCDWDDRDSKEIESLDRTAVELSKLTEIIGDICLLVYRPQSISSTTSQKLATRLREWSDGLPSEIQLSSLSLTMPLNRKRQSNDNGETRRRMVRNQGLLRLHLTHLNSIILLTRPFFLLMIAKVPDSGSRGAPLHKTITRLSSACVLCAARSVDLVMNFFAQNQQPTRSHMMTYIIFTSGIVLLLESFHQRKSEVESYITRGIFLCIFILGHYGKCDPSAKRYRNILQEMDRAARAARTVNEKPVATQKRKVSQINSILNGSSSVLNSTATSDRYMMSAPEAVSQLSSLSPQLADDEKYLTDMLGQAGDYSTNLSRMFLKAAANDGRYQIPDSPLSTGVPLTVLPSSTSTTPSSTSSRPPRIVRGENAITMPGVVPHVSGQEISPADAMSQFLMEDTFQVTPGTGETDGDFSFDLDMMEWINLASTATSSTSSTAPVRNPIAAAAMNAYETAAGMDAVRRANVDLFNGPGGSRQGWPGDNAVSFRGLMMNAEY
ncbi:fungal-specific transcription factor domain-containing protein [Lipomyces japonicus]|uniref:fungal-specific transcription factor domain-containing protein n=1 Tax=Lipomyces japonicus TaxID=56871 RepID=UPI0034CD5266